MSKSQMRDIMHEAIESTRPDIAARALSILEALIPEIGRQDKAACADANIHVGASDDGSLVVEWMLPDRRIGFGVELDPAEDGWHYVSKLPEGACDGGLIGTVDFPALVKRMLAKR